MFASNLFSKLKNIDNPIVFLEVSVNGYNIGRIYIELFADTAPKTSENFRQFCTGEKLSSNKPVGYKNCSFHRVIKDFMLQGGDILNNNGTGSISIYGQNFSDENFDVKHDGPGILSMANSGANTNGSQFFITTVKCPHLDNKHVAFGRVIDAESMNVVKNIEATPTNADDKPLYNILIVECGQM